MSAQRLERPSCWTHWALWCGTPVRGIIHPISQPTISRGSVEDCMRPFGRGFIPRPLFSSDRSQIASAQLSRRCVRCPNTRFLYSLELPQQWQRCATNSLDSFWEVLLQVASNLNSGCAKDWGGARLSMDRYPWKGLLCNAVFVLAFSNYISCWYYVCICIYIYSYMFLSCVWYVFLLFCTSCRRGVAKVVTLWGVFLGSHFSRKTLLRKEVWRKWLLFGCCSPRGLMVFLTQTNLLTLNASNNQ